MIRGQAFEVHAHETHQLAWASAGVLMVDAADRRWVLPPQLALWIPAEVPHVTIALRESVMQGIYLRADWCPLAWDSPRVLAVSPLARQLIGYLAGGLPDEARARGEAVLFDVLRPAAKATIELPMPADGRARDVAAMLMRDPADQRSLAELAHAVGSSPRTLLRLFVAETGLTFSQWRAHARLQAGISSLAEGRPVASVAGQVGYATPSAFVAAFRRVTGYTPAAYFALAQAQDGG